MSRKATPSTNTPGPYRRKTIYRLDCQALCLVTGSDMSSLKDMTRSILTFAKVILSWTKLSSLSRT